MIVSLNEIEVICKKAFEGAGFSDGDYEDVAQMIAWAEMHDLHGFEELKKILPKLVNRYIDSHLSDKPSIIYQDEHFMIVDAKQQSVLTHGALICDAIAAKSHRRGSASLRLLNCQNRKLLLGYLSKCAMRGNNISVIWQATPSVGMIANFDANKPYPIIHQYKTDEQHMDFPKACSMNVFFSQQIRFTFPKTDLPYAKLVLETKRKHLNTEEYYAYHNGINIDDSIWHELKKLASNILVESSEKSRMGAG